MTNIIQIQATFIGYQGRPLTVFSGYNTDTRVLAIAMEADYQRDRRAGCMVITNDPDPKVSRDSWFDEARDMHRAINAYFTLKSSIATDGKSSRLVFTEKAARLPPENTIERDGMDENGTKYRLSDGVTCGQVAVLAICLYVMRADTVERTVEMADTLKTLVSGGVITI